MDIKTALQAMQNLGVHLNDYDSDAKELLCAFVEDRLQSESNIYTVTAYRWGDRENHSYIVGVFSSEKLALEVAEEEEQYRGGKYVCEIIQTKLDKKLKGGIQFVKKLDDYSSDTKSWIKSRMKNSNVFGDDSDNLIKIGTTDCDVGGYYVNLDVDELPLGTGVFILGGEQC